MTLLELIIPRAIEYSGLQVMTNASLFREHAAGT